MALSHSRLLELIHYNPETGIVIWRVSRGRAIAGKEAGCISHSKEDGRASRIIKIDYELYETARLAFFYMTGRWPIPTVDHEDTNRLNNKWENLREANMTEQNWNRNFQGNICGYKHVYPNKGKNKYRVRILVNGKLKHILSTDDYEMACLVASEFVAKQHGEFARI